MQYGLSEETIEKINHILIRYPQIETVVLYGSRAKGNYHNGSDIDLTLKGESLTLSLLYEIERELDDLLLPYTFDISLYQQIEDPGLLNHIDRMGIVFKNNFSEKSLS